MARWSIEYRASTKYRVEFDAESLEQAQQLAKDVLHPLQLPGSEQEWLSEDSEMWIPLDVVPAESEKSNEL